MAYSKYDTQESLTNFLENGNLKTLYKEKFIKIIGRTNDSSEYYSDILSEIIISKKVYGNDNIEKVTRLNTYNVYHNAVTENDDGDKNNINQDFEPVIAKKLFNLNLGDLGKIIGYEIPLKNSEKDKGLGKYVWKGYARRIRFPSNKENINNK